LQNYPIEIIRSETNLGFAKGNNLGIDWALKRGADNVLLINNDTIIDPEMISIMINEFIKIPEVGIIGPSIYYLDNPLKIWFAGYNIPDRLFVLRRGLNIKIKDEKPLVLVDFVSGCGMMIKRQVIEEIGLLPDVYFMYYEDLEYCIKAKMHGWKIAYIPNAKMWHAVSLSSGGYQGAKKEYYQIRSSIIFIKRNTRGFEFYINLAIRFIHVTIFFLIALVKRRLSLNLIKLYLLGLFKGLQE
jgi:GT2 family glycosyltransferase